MRTAMSNETKETGSSFMEKLSTVIVDKRNLIFLLTIILLVFSAFSRNWVEVESDLTYYLPSDSETKQALDIMDEQFTTYGTAEVMVANITPEQAAALEPKIKEIKGVQSVDYDETTAHYNNLSALYSITFAYSEDDEACLDSLEAVKEYLSDYDLYVDTLATRSRRPSTTRSASSWCMSPSSSCSCCSSRPRPTARCRCSF